jgi:hypothetical protein
MDVARDARKASAMNGATTMTEDATSLRRCSGSARFGIEPHEASAEDFPSQPSQKDGLGRMCRVHWNAYTAGLARDAKARKAGGAGDATPAGVDGDAAVADNQHVAKPMPMGARRTAEPETT